MKLEKVKSQDKDLYKSQQPMKLNCCHCNKTYNANTMYADLDGPPYSSYYCKECAFDEEDYIQGGIIL